MRLDEAARRRILARIKSPGILGIAAILAAAVGPGVIPQLASAWDEQLPGWALLRVLSMTAAQLPLLAAPLILSLLLQASPRREVRAVLVALVMATMMAGAWMLPLAWSHTNVPNMRSMGVPFLPPPGGWTWPERITALQSGLAPDGTALPATTAAAIRDEAFALVVGILAVAFMLSAALRRTPRGINAWIALVACVAIFAGNTAIFQRGMDGGIPQPWLRLLLQAPILLVGVLVHAWCGHPAEGARARVLAWSTAAAMIAAVGTAGAARADLVAGMIPGIARQGSTAPAIDVLTLDGDPVRVQPGHGKVVVLSYWASWCGPCRSEQAFLDELLASDAGRDLVVVSVNNGETVDAARAAWQEANRTRPASMGTDSLLRRYPVRSFPSSYFIDREGIVRSVHVGYRPDVFDAELTALLAEPARNPAGH